MDRLFITIARINNVLLLFVLVGAGLVLVWVTWTNSQWQRRGAIEVPVGESASTVKLLLRFERVESVTGANTQMLLLSAEEKSGKLSSGGYGSETRNVLFLSGAEKKARWLFPKQSNKILVAEQMREKGHDSNDRPTSVLYFEYVATDTNGDGKLSAQDNSSIGLCRPNGLDFGQVLTGVTRVLSHELLDGQTLSVVYQAGRSVRHATFSVSSLKNEADQEIVSLPEEL